MNTTHRVLALFRRHWMAIFVAVLASIHVLLPNIVGRITAGDAYQSVYYSDNGDWPHYVARIRDRWEGHGGGNPYYLEHADDPYMNVSGAETVIAWIIKALGTDPVTFQAVSDASLPFFITLVFYALLYQLSNNRWLSSAIPLSLILLNIWNLDKPIHPQVNLPLLLLFLLSWFSLLTQLDSSDKDQTYKGLFLRLWPYVLACGVLIGSLYLVYFFDWSYLFVVLGCSTLLSLLKRKLDTGAINLLILATSAPFAAYFIFLVLKTVHSPFYAETAVRNGLFYSHLPESLPRLAVGLMGCVLFYALMRYGHQTQNRVAQGVFALVLANVIYPNHHIITGVVPQTAEHWSFMPILIFSIAVAYAYFVFKHAPASTRRLTTIFAVSLCTLFAFATSRLAAYLSPPVTPNKLAAFVAVQRYEPIFRYLNTSTPSDSVVLTDNSSLSFLIPAYTHNYVYYQPGTFFLPASDRELMERYLLSKQLDPSFTHDKNLGLTPSTAVLWAGIFPIEETFFFRLFRLKKDNQHTFERELEYAHETLRDLESSGPINFSRLLKYHLDYVIWDKNLHPEWDIDRLTALEKLFEENGLILYRVRSGSTPVSLFPRD